MFNNLSNNFIKIFDKLKGKISLNEEDINDAMREIRIALLEADVSLKVVKEITENIKIKAINQQIIKNISPTQQIVKIVYDEICSILGEENSNLNLSVKPPVIIMMVGLQGSGKTTTSAKLAFKYKKQKKILLASLDTYRPAAQEQLAVLGQKAEIDTLEIIVNEKPQEIARRAMDIAHKKNYDLVILDTAGRLHTDELLMRELQEIKKITEPKEIILVSDCLVGQESVNIAKYFNELLSITGIILTRFDADARGGVALSMKHITNQAIKFIGIGEKLEDLEEFHPKRIASRILDMGDVLSLVEKAANIIDQKDNEKIAKKIASGSFDINDLLAQMRNIKKIGGLSSLLSFLPGVGKLQKQLDGKVDEKIIDKQIAIILSMTYKERKDPKILNASRRRRIADGAGTGVQEVNKLIKQFTDMQVMMKQMKKIGPKNMMRNFRKS